MQLRGIIRAADLQEPPGGAEEVEMLLRVQGVGPGQPRTLIVPFAMLVDDPSLDPEAVLGRRFEGDAEEDAPGRWVVRRLDLSIRMLRPPEP